MSIIGGIHVPVMLKETLDYLNLKPGGVYIDCTFGKGGHSRAILEKLVKEEHLEKLGIQAVDGFLFDLGLSSDQLVEEDRGFSYRLNSPLDMRISKENELKAEEIINNYSCNKHPARKVFQALRIFINQELENLTKALEATFKYLAKEGRIVVISYHSLEDRIVKQTFKKYASPHFQIITKKPLIPTRLEIIENHRARMVLIVGIIIGFLIRNYILKNQMKELQKKMQEPDKEQVRNMLSALGKKPSEEQVNRFISMTKSSAKKGQDNAKKLSLKKKKK
ncbi:8528_t:CDS:2 [Funneliformis geosporum]|uniref:8528_t:CDS:1 n=1 Tax=Funneliformis geosporum TaxID=1117311 RepID=A0A9W4X291_9GLOM|nr:8528_t:CDS:2 [Funneliformis geosporum]